MIKTLIPLLVLGLSACASATDSSPLSLEDRFYQNAFYNEETATEEPLARWEEPFAVHVSGATDSDRQRIDALLQQIHAATNLDAYVVPTWKTGIRVYFVEEGEWQEIVRRQNDLRQKLGYNRDKFTCLAIPSTEPDGGNIFLIAIPKSLPEKIRAACIAQEIGHATGLYYDAIGRSDTAFGDWSGADHLTEIDFQLLRILYDPRLTPGMTWEEAKPIVRQIASELEAG